MWLCNEETNRWWKSPCSKVSVHFWHFHRDTFKISQNKLRKNRQTHMAGPAGHVSPWSVIAHLGLELPLLPHKFLPFSLLCKLFNIKKKKWIQKCWNRSTRQLLRAKRHIQQGVSSRVLAFCESCVRYSEKPTAKSGVMCWFPCQRKWHSLWRQNQKKLKSDCFKHQIC